jgi:acetyl esterase/lipase
VQIGTGTVVNAGTPQHPLPAVLLGGGLRAVILVNDGGQLLCAWLPFARTLSRAGLRVVLYDQPATDPGRALRDVTTWLRDRGNADVAYVGAGSGAVIATATAAGIRPAPYAVVALSPATSAVRTPALYAAAATGDPTGAATARRLATGNRLRLVPGNARGAALVARAGTLVTEITAYLRQI